MSGGDPIASPTLAQLYIAQGHLRKASAVLSEVLERSPLDGHALHLRTRLRVLGDAALTATVDATEIGLRWQHVPVEAAAHAVIVCFVGGAVSVDSVCCASPTGHWGKARPAGPGSAVACIGRVVAGRGFVALAVARPLSFGETTHE